MLEKFSEHEFRKNVALRVINSGQEVHINMDKLKEWNALFNDFIIYVRHMAKKKR